MESSHCGIYHPVLTLQRRKRAVDGLVGLAKVATLTEAARARACLRLLRGVPAWCVMEALTVDLAAIQDSEGWISHTISKEEK